MRRIVILVSAVFFITGVAVRVSAQNSKIGEMKMLVNVNNGIRIEVYDVRVGGMRGRDVLFGFRLKVQGADIEDSWRQIGPREVLRDPEYWNGVAFSCTYSYDYLKIVIKEGKGLACTFYIMDPGTNESIGEKSIDVKIDIRKQTEDISKEKTEMRENPGDIVVEYRVAQGVQITIRNGKLTYGRVQEIKTADNNPLSGNTYAEYASSVFIPTAEDLRAIIDIFSDNEWYSLRTDYGVGKEDRNYPTTLRFKDSNGDKTVTYRKGAMPQNEPPKAFFIIGERLVETADMIASR